MADISTITDLSGTTYDLKDAYARTELINKADITGTVAKSLSVPIATVDSTSTKTAFTVTVSEFANETALRDGLFFFIYNDKVASASGWTLNVNGLGAKPVYNSSGERTTTGFAKNKLFPCWYNSTFVSGGCWFIGYITDTNTTYSTMTMAQAQAGSASTGLLVPPTVLKESANWWANGNAAVKMKKACIQWALIVGDEDGYEPLDADVVFSLDYPILSAQVAASAGAVCSNAVYSDRSKGLSTVMGSGWSGTSFKMIYLVGTINSNGKFVIATEKLTQTVPTAEDGKYYIPIGIVHSDNTRIGFRPTGELWAFKDGKFRMVTLQTSLPAVSSSDNGKFLRVVDGSWAAATVANANGQSF